MNVFQLSYTFLELWRSNGYFLWWQSFLIALFFLICDVVICTAHWYANRGRILEYGYPKVHERKSFKKQLKNDSLAEKILMIRLCRTANKRGVYLWACWVINLLNIISAATAIVGAVGIVVTHGAGWAMYLTVIFPLGCFVGATALMLLPDLLFLPSERKRYR